MRVMEGTRLTGRVGGEEPTFADGGAVAKMGHPGLEALLMGGGVPFLGGLGECGFDGGE